MQVIYALRGILTKFLIFRVLLETEVHAVGSAVVETLRYKPEGRGIKSRWYHWIFSLT
jgi:hypothetical protein